MQYAGHGIVVCVYLVETKIHTTKMIEKVKLIYRFYF